MRKHADAGMALMKLTDKLAALARKFAKVVPALRKSKLLRAPLRGGLRARLASWWERLHGTPPDDVSHRFAARDYRGSRARHYVVHLPRGEDDRRPRPLVMVLHGCRQDNRDIEVISGFNELADRHGFLVVYPFVTSYRGLRNRNCWGWWIDEEIHAGAGEVEDLWQIIEDIKRLYPVDEQRIHVTGLSSGAGMAVAMMVAHADKIASGAAVAGVPYAERATAARHLLNKQPRNRPVVAIVKAMRAEMGDAERLVPLQIVHSENDDKVDINSARVLRDSWGHCFDVDTRHPAKVTSGREGATAWEHNGYTDDGGSTVIETLFLEGPGHGWYGGNPGQFSYPDGPDIKLDMWKFFNAHPLKRKRGLRRILNRAG
ncbi:PHB depolymerase family esterase [Gammaproteobacteria bacterium]|nr:PHB depolymerase family esterase [Gammaproteobacteria bacterium]